MSESKARLARHNDWLASECDRLGRDVIFLLQALIDITHEHPDIELPDLGQNRFPERVWRQIDIPG